MKAYESNDLASDLVNGNILKMLGRNPKQSKNVKKRKRNGLKHVFTKRKILATWALGTIQGLASSHNCTQMNTMVNKTMLIIW